jgi:molecular chaperone DnaJ
MYYLIQGDAAAEERFKKVTEAYEVLSDDKKRELYNQYGHAGVDPNFSESPFGGAGAGGFDFGDGSIHFTQGDGGELEDIFEAFFGGGAGNGRRRQRGPRRGADLQMQVEISFEEAVFGVQKDLDIRYQVADSKTNQVKTKERSVKVDIPAGMESGMNLRIKNQGAEGDPGAANGNLLVQVIVKESDYYAREGADVHTELPISIAQAILGGSLDVKTLTGTVELKIPAGSQPGARLMIRNRGIPRLNSPGSKGNHYVHLKVQIPKTTTTRQEELLREFDAAGKETLTGRIAHAAESAFEKVFGTGCKNKDDGNTNIKNSSSAAEEEDSDDEPKKQAAQ